MDLDYDRKFEEMKQYIPFLESMIKRLESTSSVSNPRQAQLDKIRSLRDLLMDKKKRMKMENLLKCEQVLVNLYEKVEQRDSLPVLKKEPNNMPKDNSDLYTVRNKLKMVTIKLQKDSVQTLPEIARASETEAVCAPGSKEPALFQRRPNKSSMSPTRTQPINLKEPSPQMTRKSYTRVLLSPEPNQKSWSADEKSTETPLFSRSPRKSPRRRSPSYHRKERKKLTKNKTKEVESKDVNITLNVPKESLSSLNTKDILSRIINCSDNDVDIDSLRELRTQILGELKETGINEDISDLILKSYKKKSTQEKKIEEIEEGELSDSESEAIENIYRSLVISDKDKSSIDSSYKISNDDKPCKIQICLVINTDKNKSVPTNHEQLPIDKTDFETFFNEKPNVEVNKEKNISDLKKTTATEDTKLISDHDQNVSVQVDDEKTVVAAEIETKVEAESKETNNPNSYKTVVGHGHDEVSTYTPEDNSSSNIQIPLPKDQNTEICEDTNISTDISKIEIPLLEPTKKVSEIDILQALKKEILSETNNVLISDVGTPALHQPKVTKVVNANEIGSKKRISIENYKAKTNNPLKNIYVNETSSSTYKDDSRKQSLKLTEKECERFNFSSKLTFEESSDDEGKSILSVDEVYGNLAPKSPDHEDFADAGIKPPVIIPSDPVQTTIVSSEADIDMRKIIPVLQCNLKNDDNNAFSFTKEKTLNSFNTDPDIAKNNDKPTIPLLNPRMKKDINSMVKPVSPNPYTINTDKTSRSTLNYPNINLLQNVNVNSPLTLNLNMIDNRNILSPNLPTATPNIVPNLGTSMTPVRTPNVHNMTPNARSYDMTPSRHTDNDDFMNQQHVYAPMFPINDRRDHIDKQQWDNSDNNGIPFWEDPIPNSNLRDKDYRETRNMPMKRDIDVDRYRDVRGNSIQRESEYNPMYEQYQESPRNDRFIFEKINPCHRLEGPTTPNHPFGRLDCPPTPTPCFGRLDCPPTPTPSFGRLDCPPTPTPSFGRMDMPMTPVHPFGRSECPSTPNHPFGRPEPLLSMPLVRPDFNQHVPNQSYGKSLDPRLNRNTDYDNYQNRDDDRDRCYFQEPKFNINSYKTDHKNRNNNPEVYRRYQREQSIGRNDRNKNHDHKGHNYRETHRDASVGRYGRDYDNDRSFSRSRNSSNRNYDYRHKNDFRNYDESDRYSHHREKSVTRTASQSMTRDPNGGRTRSKDNELSIQLQSSNSFTIDTSINRSFQESKNRKNSFDVRRQRASSVGRTLCHDSSINKVLNSDSKHIYNNLKDKHNFRRSCSVGREIRNSKQDFKDIKADLISFKLKRESRWNKEVTKKEESRNPEKNMKNFDPRSRKEKHQTQITNEGNLKYSPRKNFRDPRMRRENSYENKSTSKDSYRDKLKDSKNYGIVYTSDNITKGTILGPGYGVKNYKIPKIKRPQETEIKTGDCESKVKDNINVEADNKISETKPSLEKKAHDEMESNITNKRDDSIYTNKERKVDVTNNLNKSSEKSVQDKILNEINEQKVTIDSCKNQEIEKEKPSDNMANDTIDSVDKRITRSASKSLSMDFSMQLSSPVKRTKRGKKCFVYMSDSDDDDKVKNTLSDNSTESSEKAKSKTLDCDRQLNSDITSKVVNIQTDLSDSFDKSNDRKTTGLNSNLGIDDLEIFSDNIASDPAIDNINALIADLDDDIDSPKTVDTKNNFTKELTLETMLENITSPDSDEKMITVSNNDVEIDENNKFQLKYASGTKLICSNEVVENTSDISYAMTPILELNANNNKINLVNTESDSLTERESKKLETLPSEDINKIKNQDKNEKNVEIDDNYANEAIVTTSGDGENKHAEPQLTKGNSKIVILQSKPDSTISSSVAIDSLEYQRNVPDSTNDSNSEMNSTITSTNNTAESINKPIGDASNTPPSIENIGKLLSILQDKNKIKELLVLLGDQSTENEKIKKKLEKLSEIVSDEEDTLEKDEPKKLQSDLNEEKFKESDNSVIQKDEKIEITEKSNDDLKLPLDKSLVDNKQVNDSVKESDNFVIQKGEKIEITEKNNDDLKLPLDESLVDNKQVNDFVKESDNSVIQKDEKIEITEKNNDGLKLHLDESLVDNKQVNNSVKERGGNNIISESNENVAEVTISVTKHENELHEEENKISIVSEIRENKIDVQYNNVHKSKETQECDEKNKNIMPKKGKRKTINKGYSVEERRLRHSDAANLSLDKPTEKKPSRELQKLHKDIREMFIRDDVLSATGIRMCRLAKLVDETKKQKEETSIGNSNQEPVVVLEKCNELNTFEASGIPDKVTRKNMAKGKIKLLQLNSSVGTDKNVRNKKVIEKLDNSSVNKTKIKPKEKNDFDPYVFETDSVKETNRTNDSKIYNNSSESENESLSSSKSFGSTEVLAEIKKKVKRKRNKGWKAGIIKPKNKKKKMDRKLDNTQPQDEIVASKKIHEIPDQNCFTDKNYCFNKNISTYDCRLCTYNGVDIVYHYKNQHPHSEIPLSRMSPVVAMEAIKESDKMNFQAICKVPSKRYICRFCFKEFGRKKPVLELFFWHIVSMHTGEYKQLCSECLNISRCPFNLDIPPPPKDNKGQLLGYVCEKCNYTQVSLENLKSHVIIRHNDEQTAVYAINLSVTTKSIKNNLLTEFEDVDDNNTENLLPRVLRSSRSNQSTGEISDVRSDSTSETFRNSKKLRPKLLDKKTVSEEKNDMKSNKIQLKITFENDNIDDMNFDDGETTTIKTESELKDDQETHFDNLEFEPENQVEEFDTLSNSEKIDDISNDIINYPHFKIKYSESGSKEYICCINGKDLHYRTTLLISFKKHVQLKHSEHWDGYCFICKVIVTTQGIHLFKDCLQHFLDQHIDNFPILEELSEHTPLTYEPDITDTTICESPINKSLINVRPLSQLISKSYTSKSTEETSLPLPVIESVISLRAGIENRLPSASYPNTNVIGVVKQYNNEEAQAEIMSGKHRVVLEAMMTQDKLVQVFKCAGRFCSFTSDSPENALLHASAHTRVGGENSLICAYCDFDSSNNAIDLITHVFKNHGCCQYVCGICFYRAAASQLVNAHVKRVHAKVASVAILQAKLQTAPIKEDDILSREAAVPYYQCCTSGTSEGSCKFRTYTPGKFCEHLQIRHSSATEHSCFMCSATLSTPADLIRHLKTHGLKLYQCTWCVFGADNETDLLAHASAIHPDKQPKAYLRIITNKEGTSEFRVLPLAHLNKSDIPVVQVTKTNVSENPVREAERSIELEKLIGTTLKVESTTDAETITIDKSTSDTVSQINEPTLENLSSIEGQLTQKVATPTPQADSSSLPGYQLISVTKSETTEISLEKPASDPNIVYCLDSDEDDTTQNTNVLSEDQASSKPPAKVQSRPKILPVTQLFLCAKCKIVLKCGAGFKNHVMSCFSQISDPIPCAHCSFKVNKKNIVTHYTKTHSELSRNHICPKCFNKFSTLTQLREHKRKDHCIDSNSQLNSDKDNTSTNLQSATTNRRKRSIVCREKTLEPPEKVKRFGPHDVNLLPINPILDDYVFCSLCEFSTKVRLNMVRHLQLHAEQQIVPKNAPVNPVPHLETNEKHFDKMLNLASSSIVSRTPDRTKTDSNFTITLMLPPELVSRYPKYIPEKHRHTCGAKGCSYISVDESMFKCHWETLHSGTSDYYCVHCPPNQQLDTSSPLTVGRIIGHLKMHDSTLYACSLCSYYHYKRRTVENHLFDIHKSGQVMVVREEGNTLQASTSQAQISAPTMDLKPWLCGLCKFKSLLRPEIVDHCANVHNSKMQYKCAYCAFRTSNCENITKHQYKSHSDKPEEIFYYYYREGSIPENPDGIPLWQKQSQKCNVAEPKIKTEVPSDTSLTPQLSLPLCQSLTTEVDLNLVKKEVIEPVEETIEDLCKDFGEFCEPNGLKYKCTLCKNVVEDNLDAMQSHLYEELKYRKWGCSICSYKAFHKAGLNGHMQTEHRQNKEPIALEIDNRVETWVAKLLEYQSEIIKKNKENLAKQKEEILRNAPGPSRSKSPPKHKSDNTAMNSSSKPTMLELERLFGPLGLPLNMSFCCPKCNSTFKDEDPMKNHLESELNKIRWFCSTCSIIFQTYHEAQFHCRSVHLGQSARPMEATRDVTIRRAWVEAVIRVQKLNMKYVPLLAKSFVNDAEKTDAETESPENSLLVVRYEQRIPTPEEQMSRNTPVLNPDSDDDKLIIDEPIESRKLKSIKSCPHCDYTTVSPRILRDHVLLRHYNLRPFTCGYCGITGTKKILEQHQRSVHTNLPIKLMSTTIPTESPSEFNQKQSANLLDSSKLICLVCRNSFTEIEIAGHVHDKTPTSFGKRGEVVMKCNICFTLHKDVNAYFNHHKHMHESMSTNYVFSKLSTMSNESKVMLYACSNCDQKFNHLRYLKTHSDSYHGSKLNYTIVSKLQEMPSDDIINLDEDEEVGSKRNNKDIDSTLSKKVAKKSTTKLPFNKPFARKSTTKLPFDVQNKNEISHYGTRPSTDGLDGVTTMMSFGNTILPFTLKKLNEIININPVVEVEDMNV